MTNFYKGVDSLNFKLKAEEEKVSWLNSGIYSFGYKFVENYRDNKEMFLEIVKIDGTLLRFASNDLRCDKDVVIEAIKQHGWSLRFASKEFQSDKSVVLMAVMQDEMSLNYASDEIQELCKDKDPVEILKSCVLAEKLQSVLSQKTEFKPSSKKLKI